MGSNASQKNSNTVYQSNQEKFQHQAKNIKDLFEGFGIGSEGKINASIKMIQNQLKKPDTQWKNVQWLKYDLKNILENINNFRQDYMNYLAYLKLKPDQIQKVFPDLLNSNDIKKLKSPEQLFKLLYTRIRENQFIPLENDQIQQKPFNKSKNEYEKSSKLTSEESYKINLGTLLTVFWVGTQVLNLINWKLLPIEEQKTKEIPQLSNWEDCIQSQVHQIVSSYYEWMTTIPSFDIIIDAFNNKKSINILKIHQENEDRTVDIWINKSAAAFKVKLVNFINNWLETYEFWKILLQEFIQKEGQLQVRNGRKEEFDEIVKKITQHLEWRMSDMPVKKQDNQKDQKDQQVQIPFQINQRYSQQIESLRANLRIKDDQISVLRRQIDKKDKIIEDLKKSKQRQSVILISNSSNLANEIDEYKKKLSQVQKRERQLKQKVTDLENKLQFSQTNVNNLNDKLKKLKEQFYSSVFDLNQKIHSLVDKKQKNGKNFNKKYPENQQKFLQQLKKLMSDSKISIENANSSFKQSIQTYQQKITHLNGEIDRLNNLCESLQSQNSQSTQQIHKSYKQTIDSLNENLKKTNQKCQEQVQIISKSKQVQNKFNVIVPQLQKTIKDLKDQLVKKEDKMKKLDQQKQNQKKVLNDKNKQLEDQVKKISETFKQIEIRQNELKQKNKELFGQIQVLKNVKPPKSYDKYFNGYILSIDTPEDTQWVVNNIEKYLGREIRSTRMICKMDLQNKNNLHNYIDGIPNIVFIAKMQNGQIILAYSEPAFSKQMGNINYRPGIMLGLRNRKVFTVKREKTNKLNLTDPRPITWDEQYIIWGNTDLRLRMTSTEFYSNYATPNGSFEERGNSKKAEIQDLFMMGDRTTQVVDYEFYEVKFEPIQ